MLSNRKVIVTGAASGIGKAIVNQCLHEGASVIACDRNEQALRDLKESMDDSNAIDTYQVDVSKYEEVAAFFSYVEAKHSEVDGLVNNAGIYLAKHILDYQENEIDKVLDINIKGYIYFSQMLARNCSIADARV